jgi:hypothetical protein
LEEQQHKPFGIEVMNNNNKFYTDNPNFSLTKRKRQIRQMHKCGTDKQPFNAGIKSLRETLSAEVFYWGF